MAREQAADLVVAAAAGAAQGVIDSQIEQAYYKTKIATAAQGAADLLRAISSEP